MNGGEMISPPTARGELPRLYELDPLRFQELCRDLFQAEPDIATAEVFGTPGQLQRGVDIVATPRQGTSIAVGQCKCIEPDSLTVAALRQASRDFLDHLAYWRDREVRRFIVFVAPDASRTEIQEEHLRQREAFRQLGISYELWGAGTIQNKLRPQPGITSTYLGDYWRDILCGTAISGFPRESVIIDGILRAQLDTLAGYVSTAAEAEVEALRLAWREGRRREAFNGLAALHESGRWGTFSPALKSTVLRFESQLALEQDDLARAKPLADEAALLNPTATVRLQALIARSENDRDRAISLLQGASDKEALTLRAALLMESNRVSEGLTILGEIAGHAEAHRLQALGFMLQRDPVKARLEIAKAVELSPTWHATLYTKATVYYLSGLSPAILPPVIPQWPEPQDWNFIKTDDESRSYFDTAVAALTILETEREATVEERRVYETWHLACLANDPERRDEATSYCRDVLKRDPGHYRVLAWALARRLEVDLSSPAQALKEQIARGTATPPEVIALTLAAVGNGDLQGAKSVLESTRPLFADEGAKELWRFWMTQVTSAVGEASPLPDVADASQIPEMALVILRARARQDGDWEPLISELRRRADAADGRAAFELCELLGTLGRWTDATPYARILAGTVATADALLLGCVTLYNAREYEDCVRELDLHRELFPHAEFPTQAQRLRLAAQRELGLLPAASAGAEELFRREPTVAHFKILADLYFEKGDFASLVVLARRHQQFEDLTNRDLLRLSMRIAIEDRSTAADLWRRCLARGFDDEEVSAALEIGYKLGLDRELRSLVHRLADLAAKGDGTVRQMGFEQVKQLLTERRSDVERVYRMYLTGQIPIHLAAEHLRRPIVSWYRRALLLNEESGRSIAGPTFVRSGWRTGRSVTFDPDITLSLHADLTALFLAFHLGVLDRIEATFRPIVLPHLTLTALAAMRDAARPHQPARVEALRALQDAVSRGLVRVEHEAIDPDVHESEGVGPRSNRLLTLARRNSWLLTDFLPLTNQDGQPVALGPDLDQLLRTGHALVEALHSMGEISKIQADTAYDALGPEHVRSARRDVSKDATVLVSAGVLELLASGQVLEATARAFSLRVERNDFETSVVAELLGYQASEEDATWITSLITRLNRGLEDGAYRVLPDFMHTAEGLGDAAESPAVNCLLDLLRFAPSRGDVIWADDRWLNSYAHRDSIPVLDTFDLLHLLQERGTISSLELLQFSHRLRDCDLRLFSLQASEVREMTHRGQIVDGILNETRELRTLRRYYARSLAAGELLRVAPVEQGLGVEWPFLLASGAAVINAVVELWEADPIADSARPRAEWVLRNLYAPDRGRAFTSAERSADIDLRLEAVALNALLTHTLGFGLPDDTRQARRSYINWVYHRLLRRRFEADPRLRATTLDAFKQLMSQSVDMATTDKELRRVAAVIIRALVTDLPDELATFLAQDGEFLTRLGLSRSPVVRIGPHGLNPDELWKVGADVLRTRGTALIKAGEHELVVKLLPDSAQADQLVVEDKPARMQYIVLSDVLGILSDSVSERESALKGISRLFDLPQAANDDAIARIAALGDPAARVMEVAKLRAASSTADYAELERKLTRHEAVGESDFMVEDVAVILRHLRLISGSGDPLAQRLERAAAMLVVEVGLEEATIRFAGLPISLPTAILAAFDALSSDERRLLLKRLLRALGASPLGNAHLTRLFVHCASDRSSYARYARASARAQLARVAAPRVEAWLEVLRLYGNDLCHVEAFRRLPTDVRLCVVWAHGDRVFRIIANAGASMEWVRDHFGHWSSRLPAEIAFTDSEYATDVSNPKRLDETAFTLSGVAYAFGFGADLTDQLISIVSQFVESDPSKLIAVMRDFGLAPDALGSISRYEGQTAALLALSPDLRERFAPATLMPQVVAAIDRIQSGEAELTEWGVLNAVVHDYALPEDVAPRLRDAILRVDFVRLHKGSSAAALLAAIFAAQHAGRLGVDVARHIRSQLLALVGAWREMPSASAKEVEQAANVLISAAFYLVDRSEGDSQEGNRFGAIAQLLDEMVQSWPALVERCQFLIDKLVDGLPNADSRWLWQFQVKLRAMR
jgi:tetratricopeptide (TPR) repeat protein